MDSLMQTVTQALTGLLTDELIGAVAFTLAVTYIAKICAEHWMDSVTDTARRWRAFIAVTTVAVGTLAGTVAWLATESDWLIVPAVAAGSWPGWKLVQAFMPARVRNAFLTATDRKFKGRRADA